MKYFYLMLLTSLLSTTSFAQNQIVFDEQFNDNDNQWTVDKNESYTTEVSNGYYLMYHKTDDGDMFYHSALLNPEKDFEIEAKISLIGGALDYGYGLYMKDGRISKKTTNNFFTISGDGYFKIYTDIQNGESVNHAGWVTHSAIAQGYNQSNILKIKKSGSSVLFFINDREVYKISNQLFWGKSIGFVVYNKVEAKADYITVKQDTEVAIHELKNSTTLKKENLGSSINSIHNEIMPVISADGKTLYFDVKGDPANIGNEDKDDVWYSTLKNDGTWSKRVNIGAPINNQDFNYVISITPDNNSLLLHDRYGANGEWAGEGFSLSHRNKNGWSMPEDMIMDDYYNLSDNTSFCLSPDRKVLLMAIERKDGYGEHDLYVSFQKKDGRWSAPKNIGVDINTYGDEVTPFIAADGKTLYFSTDGKPGYGNNDIFMTRRINDSWTKWTEPLNLGPDVNTKVWDGYYTVPASGNYAYVVSSNKSLGLDDIFRIQISESAKPEPVVIIYGKVLDKVTKQPLAATINYHELSTGADAGSARSNPKDGSYKIILPYGKAYGFLAEKSNFLSESDNIDLTTIKEYTEIERDLYLSPIEIGKTITLNNVFFVRSKAELLPGSYSELDRLVKVLTDNPALKIELSGHTDNVGDPALNTKLSEDRVVTIKNYLISKNISAKRLSGKGYGGSKPIASNATEETRKLNRRVEFIIVGK